MAKKESGLKFRGKPLVRCGDVIFYGNIADSYVVRLTVKTKVLVSDVSVSDIITVELLKSAAVFYGNFKPLKNSDKRGLYEALDLGSAWLERALRKD
ncbi:MAG: hypothetical protein CfP315_0143 [Candidatus Improbicoccus pseudotrichonymphae]|uniref:Uncharacterized protein n=1 Tax=Candidatus Improbicoccus pseudotrichonymphae TaxID=3033792 RepID=A0AA48HUJ9_9FIRM|nr:MAG: hypothetical protein CfP315_0143 [Candidatus Improbicoccus pseudotrichonymphae]